MLLKAWIFAHGGLWAYRQRCLRDPSPFRRRIHARIYAWYLEGLGSYIALGAHFDSAPIFPHGPMGVFIAPTARLGTDVKIFQQTTIGVVGLGPAEPAATVGDRVLIGAGAKIIGPVTIGNDARVGAGAIVVTDVPIGGVAVSPRAVVRSPASE